MDYLPLMGFDVLQLSLKSLDDLAYEKSVIHLSVYFERYTPEALLRNEKITLSWLNRVKSQVCAIILQSCGHTVDLVRFGFSMRL